MWMNVDGCEGEAVTTCVVDMICMSRLQARRARGRTSFVATFRKIMEVLGTVNATHHAEEISIVFMTDGDDTCHRKVHDGLKSTVSLFFM